MRKLKMNFPKLTRTDLYALFLVLFVCFACTCSKSQDAQAVYRYVKMVGIKHPEIVTAQAILETGWFDCNNCSMEVGNIFGFLYKGKYLDFCFWDESVRYYKWWQDQLYKGGDYYDFLKRVGYATDPYYISKLKKISFEHD